MKRKYVNQKIVYLVALLTLLLSVSSVNAVFVSRTTDWANDTHVDGTNSHGNWQYWIKEFAFDRLDYSPGELNALNYASSHNRYQLYDTVDGWWQYHTIADASTFETLWNSNGIDYGKQSWVVATFKNPESFAIDVDISGATTWQMDRTASTVHTGIVKFEIAVISSDFSSKTAEWVYEESTNAAIGTYNVPDPALSGVTVAPGEYIAFAFRGNRYNYRNTTWHNSALTMEYIPEPATVALLGLGGLALGRKRSMV